MSPVTTQKYRMKRRWSTPLKSPHPLGLFRSAFTLFLPLLFLESATMSPSAVAGAKSYSIAAIPADGIGPEVIEAGITALNALTDKLKTFRLEFKNYDWSSETFKKTGKYIPDGGLDELKKHDAIFFGAVGAPGKKCNVQNIGATLT